VTYDFGALEPSDPTQCQVYAFLKDSQNNPLSGATVTVKPNRDESQYVEAASRIIATEESATTDANGFVSFNLIISDDYETDASNPMQYVMTITPSGADGPIELNGTSTILFTVPNQATANITDQVTAA
jgi:hypothetical protein